MAQHFRIYEESEPKLFRSIRRIAKYLMTAWGPWSYIQDFNVQIIYRKRVTKLSSDYPMNGATRAFSVGPYDLQDKRWDERKDGGVDFRKTAFVEVHTDNNGNIKGIYYPL